MVHLNNVDRPGSDVDAYVNGLDRILRMKATVWSRARSLSQPSGNLCWILVKGRVQTQTISFPAG